MKKFVPIRLIFHTNSSHFVKFAQVVKLYVAYMRNLHINKILPKSAAFCIRFQFFTCMSGFYNVVKVSKGAKIRNRYNQVPHLTFKQVTDNSICFTVEKSGTGVRLQINYMSRVARKRFFGVRAPDSQACVHEDTETSISLLILD